MIVIQNGSSRGHLSADKCGEFGSASLPAAALNTLEAHKQAFLNTYSVKVRKGKLLTVEAIQAAAVKYFEETGKWPSLNTTDAVPGMPGEKWGAISDAGRNGHRGLEKGQTLSEILKPLKEEYGSKIRGAPLTIEAIREAAIKHFEKTGEWPSEGTQDKVPGVQGETWRAISRAGRDGYRGLEKGQTLSEILKPLKEEYGSKIRGAPLTIEAIREAAIEYFEKTGQWPSERTQDKVPGVRGETWSAINQAGRNGHRGLEKGQTLAAILRPLKLEYGSKVYGAPLTIEAIREAAIKHFEKTGKWPRVDSTTDEVPGMPGETWHALDAAGRNGNRGLEKGQTLFEILKSLKEAHGSKVSKDPLTVEAIEAAAVRYFEKTGKWPSASTTAPVPGMPGESWAAINTAGKNGYRGFEAGQTLAAILRPLKLEYGSKVYGALLTVEVIEAAAVRYFEKTGKWPSASTTDEVPGMSEETWNTINAAGRRGHRGLKEGQTLSKIIEPLKERFTTILGTAQLPRCFYPDREEAQQRLSARARKLAEKHLGATIKENRSITFAKGEAFEQLVGLLLLSTHEEKKVIPQYCLVVDSERGYYGMRADYRAGDTIYEVKWGGAADNIEETYQKHRENLPEFLDYELILLNKNGDVTIPYSLFNCLAKESHLGDWLLEAGAYMEELVANEKAEEMIQLRDYLYGLLMKGNTLTGIERQNFLAEELTEFLDSEDKKSYAGSHRYALYCPLSAHFEYKGKLYSAVITPRALYEEKPEQFKALYSFGRLVFEDPLDRDIAVMCELSGDQGGLSVETILRKETGLVENPIFHLPGVGEFSKTEIPNLESLKKHLHFVDGNFEFGLEYIAYFGSRA